MKNKFTIMDGRDFVAVASRRLIVYACSIFKKLLYNIEVTEIRSLMEWYPTRRITWIHFMALSEETTNSFLVTLLCSNLNRYKVNSSNQWV